MTSLMKTSVYLVETIVSDLFIVCSSLLSICLVPISSSLQLYRCYIVWNASIPMIVLPVILYIADIGMPPYHPQRRRTLNAIFRTSFRDRDRGSLFLVARWAGYRLQPEARANHKRILLLHSRLECCLHRYVSCIYPWKDNVSDIPSGLFFPQG